MEKTTTSDDGSNIDLVSQINNHLYFYTEIDNKSCYKLMTSLRNAVHYTLSMKDELGISIPIILHINSCGGSISDSMAIYDALTNITAVPVYGVIEGQACSGAGLMLMGCDKRTMTDNSVFMMHQLGGGVIGKYSEIKDHYENSDIYMDMLKKVYLKHTKVLPSQIDELLSHDIYWNKQTCIKYGIVEE